MMAYPKLPKSEFTQKRLAAIETLQQFLTRHFFCPECQHCADEKPRFEDNGCATSSVDYGQLCTKCGTTWAPNFV